MKQIITVIFIIAAVAIVVLGLPAGTNSGQSGEADFLRLHIRANSNSAVDQDIKYAVKQEIVDELTPLFVDVTSKKQAMEKLNLNLWKIKSVADRVLAGAGFGYAARVGLKTEYFPTRAYNEYSLPEGVYDALIVELGAGVGDNWWCCIYPPLCFLENNIGGDKGVVYRSKLQEIIGRYF